jgi:rubrerythrin
MEIYLCRVCANSFLEFEKPGRCPFCGARGSRILRASDYEPAGLGELAGKSRENLDRALQLEASGSAFYRGAAKVADTVAGQALFRALSRTAAERAAVLCRILDLPVPEETYETGACSPSHKENLAEAGKREERAVHLYGKFLDETSEERVKEVLEAFIEAESDQLGLSG